MNNVFKASINVPAGSVVTSQPVFIDQASTLTVDYGTIIKNGQDVGQSANLVYGDSVSLQCTAQGLDSVAFVVYQLSGIYGVWTVSSYLGSNYNFSFTIADPEVLPRNAYYQSENISVAHLISPIEVAVPNVYSATVVKNGLDTGLQRVSVFNGDTFALKFYSGNFDSLFNLPIAAGSWYDDLVSTLAPHDAHVTPFYLTPVSTTPYTDVLSDVITVSGIDTSVVLTTTNCTIYKNNVDVGTSVSVQEGDVVRFGTKSGFSRESVQCVIKCGDYTTSWTIYTTEATRHQLPAFATKNVLPFSDFTPTLSNLGMFVNGVFTSFSAQSSLEDTTDHAFFTSYAEDLVYVSSISGATLFKKSLAAGSKPLSVCGPVVWSDNIVANKFVTCNGSGKVAELDTANGYAVLKYHTVGLNPVGMAWTDNYIGVVANSGDGTVSFLQSDGGTGYNITSLSIGGTPYEVATSSGGIAWVTDFTQNRLVKILNGVATYFTTGTNPTGVKVDEVRGLIYVASLYENKIYVHDLATGTVLSTVDVATSPFALSVVENSGVYVAHLGQSLTSFVSASTLSVTETLYSGLYGYGIYSDGVNTLALSLYQNIPKRGVAQVAPTFNVSDKTGVALNTTLVFSATITNTNNRPVKVSIPALPGAYLTINGLDVGTQATVLNGDVLEIHSSSSSYYYETTVVGLALGTVKTLHITTLPDLVPEYLNFGGIYNQEVGTIATSVPLTVKGMTPGFTTTLTFDGTIWLNGVKHSGSADIKSGDVVQLEHVTQEPYGEVKIYKAQANGADCATFKIAALNLMGGVKYGIESNVAYAEDLFVREKRSALKASKIASSALVVGSATSIADSLLAESGTQNNCLLSPLIDATQELPNTRYSPIQQDVSFTRLFAPSVADNRNGWATLPGNSSAHGFTGSWHKQELPMSKPAYPHWIWLKSKVVRGWSYGTTNLRLTLGKETLRAELRPQRIAMYKAEWGKDAVGRTYHRDGLHRPDWQDYSRVYDYLFGAEWDSFRHVYKEWSVLTTSAVRYKQVTSGQLVWDSTKYHFGKTFVPEWIDSPNYTYKQYVLDALQSAVHVPKTFEPMYYVSKGNSHQRGSAVGFVRTIPCNVYKVECRYLVDTGVLQETPYNWTAQDLFVYPTEAAALQDALALPNASTKVFSFYKFGPGWMFSEAPDSSIVCSISSFRTPVYGYISGG